MKTKARLERAYSVSENIVAREIHGEFVIIPITSGIGNFEDEIFTLNKTGIAIWNNLDGKRNLKAAVEKLSSEFKASSISQIEKDIIGLVTELLKRGMVVEAG